MKTLARFVLPLSMLLLCSCSMSFSLTSVYRSLSLPPMIELLAGSIAGSGAADGAGGSASFNNPQGSAVDSFGNLYVVDTGNNTIRVVSPAGTVTTLAGTAGVTGSSDGTGAAASFNGPVAIALDSSNNAYVTDTNNHTIRKISPAGVVTTFAGTVGIAGAANGTGTAASFKLPQAIAVDSSNIVYVADTGNFIIREITPAGVVTTLAGHAGSQGAVNATGTAAEFGWPQGITVDSAGNVYVADNGVNAIRKVTSAGVVTTLAGTFWVVGSANGTGPAASFAYPHAICVDGSGNVYVADTNNNLIRMVTSAGVVTTLAGINGTTGDINGAAASATFNFPWGVSIDSSGNLYVTDSGNNILRKINTSLVVSTLAGSAGVQGSTNGTGTNASFNAPFGVATDSSGNIYVADTNNDLIREITPYGLVITLAGTAGVAGSANGTGTAASFNLPEGVAVDSNGNVYVADTGNDLIRMITPAGVVSTLAGSVGVAGSANGTGIAATFNRPYGVAVDSSDNVYVADTHNHMIRMITPGGVVTTLAGDAGISGTTNATGIAAQFQFPYSLVVDAYGNVFVADTYNSLIREITPAGVVTTYAGTGAFGYLDGTATTAQFNVPTGITIDTSGNLYVADSYNLVIRQISPAGMVNTIIGEAGSLNVALGALPGTIPTPNGIGFFAGVLFISSRNGVLYSPAQ